MWVLSSPNVLSPQFSAKSLPFAFGTKVLTLCGDFLLLYGVSWFVMILHAMHLVTHPLNPDSSSFEPELRHS